MNLTYKATKYLTLLTFILFFGDAQGQYYTNQNKVWAFGMGGGLDFNSGSPVVIPTSINTNEGCASVADATGALQFYTNGKVVYNRTGAVMPSGAAIVPYNTASTTQATVIVPSLSNASQYYIFSLEEWGTAVGGGRLCYSIVDMTLAGGFGDLLPGFIGIPMGNGYSEKMTPIASDDCNVWVVVHAKDTAEFFAFKITAAGVSTTPVKSFIGSFTGIEAYTAGIMKASPDRHKLVTNVTRVGLGSAMGCELYDFNPATGVVSNLQVLSTANSYYGTEFSPDNTKLYSFNISVFTATLEQYDITLPTTAAIIGSMNVVYNVPKAQGFDLRIGPDAKIYTPSVPLYSQFLDCIPNPNVYGLGCGYTVHAISLSPNTGVVGMPSLVVAITPVNTNVRHDTTVCVPPVTGITIAPHFAGASFLWYDGSTNPTNTVTTAGSYWVTAQNGCATYTDTIVVHALPADPPPVISGTSLYCLGDAYIPPTATGTGLLWYISGSTTPTATPPVINTNITGTYTIYASQAITCEGARDSILVTVKPGIKPDFSVVAHIRCTGGLVDFTNTTANASSYLWNFGDSSLVNDTSAVATSHLYTTQGTYYVKLSARDGACSRDTTIKVDIHHTVSPDFVFSKDTLCAGETVSITDASTPAGSVTSVLWDFGDGTTSPSPSPVTHLYSGPGEYTVKMAIVDTSGCPGSVTNGLPVFQISVALRDTTLCLGHPFPVQNAVTIKPSLPINDTYLFSWSPADNLSGDSIQTPVFTGLGSLTYTLTATLAHLQCSASGAITINSVPGRHLANVTPDPVIPYGGSAQLNADSDIYYRWLPNDGSLNNNNINSPVARPLTTTTYTVYGYDIYGCEDSATVTVHIDSSMSECIPTAFTPDGDGLNDIFKPACEKFQSLVDFRIFNRWGQQIFYSSNYNTGWDGKLNGEPLDLGVYFYQITIAKPGGKGTNIIYKGDVTLVR